LPAASAACLLLLSSPALRCHSRRRSIRAGRHRRLHRRGSQRHGFEPERHCEQTFAQTESKPSILQAIARPAERTLTWDEYRQISSPTAHRSRRAGLSRANRPSWSRHRRTSGVPIDIMLGIVGVETFYGENIGKHRVIDALATLAFDYPPRAGVFPQGTRAVPAHGARRRPRPAEPGRLVRGGDGNAAVHAQQFPQLRRRRRRRRHARPVERLGGRVCERRQLPERCTAGVRANR
jgi:membrane-bound lytic murein transglycosylase B